MEFWVSMFIYPLLGNWIWGGGWLQNLGRSMGIGNSILAFCRGRKNSVEYLVI